MKVYVARHAETNYNVLDLCNGDPSIDVYLTPKGIAQAGLLAESLRSAKLELIITSQFSRTKETARIVNQFHHVPTAEDARINDIRTGFEGRPSDEFRQARRAAKNRWTVRLNGGESFEDEKARVASFLQDLRARPEKCVLVVTHQAIARLIYAVSNNIPNEKVDDLKVDNTHSFEIDL